MVSAGVQTPQKVVNYLLAQGDNARQTLQGYVDTVKDRVPEGREIILGEIEGMEEGPTPRRPGAPICSTPVPT